MAVWRFHSPSVCHVTILYTFVCVCVCMYVCMYGCMCMYVCMYAHSLDSVSSSHCSVQSTCFLMPLLTRTSICVEVCVGVCECAHVHAHVSLPLDLSTQTVSVTPSSSVSLTFCLCIWINFFSSLCLDISESLSLSCVPLSVVLLSLDHVHWPPVAACQPSEASCCPVPLTPVHECIKDSEFWYMRERQ